MPMLTSDSHNLDLVKTLGLGLLPLGSSRYVELLDGLRQPTSRRCEVVTRLLEKSSILVLSPVEEKIKGFENSF